MGLGSLFEGAVLTRYKADTSDMRAGIRELRGEEKKRAQEAVEGIERQNKSIDGLFKSYVDFKMGASDAFAIAKAGLDEYAQKTRLAAGAASIDIGTLSKAAGGLKSQMDLLRVAQAGAQGAFKLNTQEMAKVVEGMRALEAQGFDVAEVTNKITKAIQEGAISQLEEFGIKLQSTGTIAGDKKLMLEALGVEVAEVGGAYNKAGDDVQRAGVQWTNALSSVKVAIGALVAEMGPLLESLASAVGLIAQVAGSSTGKKIITNAWRLLPHGQVWTAGQALYGALSGGGGGGGGGAGADDPVRTLARQFMGPDTGGRGAFAGSYRATPQWAMDLARQTLGGQVVNGVRGALGAQFGPAPTGPSWLGRSIGDLTGQGRARFNEDYYSRLGAALGDRSRGRGGAGGYSLDAAEIDGWNERDIYGLGGDPDWAAGMARNDARLSGRHLAESGFGGMDLDMAGAKASAGAARQSRLEEMFGPVSDFDAYAKGFQLLETAVGSAFDAWMTGAKGLGAAMKEAVAGFAKSLAMEALMQTLRHGAYALGSLAFGDVRGAAAHGISAAKWGAVAVVAGGAAKMLGGGVSSGAGASGGGYRALPGGSGASGTRTTNIVFGGGYDDSPRQQRHRVSRALWLAEQDGFSPRPPGVEFR
jgi:hypothetical protein